VHAHGRIGDADPVQAIADALPTFPADELIISGTTECVTDLVSRARSRFGLPIRGAPATAALGGDEALADHGGDVLELVLGDDEGR
jgi:hypothetical protein